MRGEVEIWRGDNLLHKESNLLVNGAGETIVDMLTVSPSFSGIASASSILDTSNYTIQAISFGTDNLAFKNNAHFLDEAKGILLSSVHAGTAVGVVSEEGLSISSYSPVVGLSHSPNPYLSVLEPSGDVSAQMEGVNLSSIVAGNGQNLNLIPAAYHHAVFINTAFSSLSSVGADVLGCWPDGSSLGGTNFSAFDGNGYAAGDVVFSSLYNGIFNEASSMDTSGFVNMVMSGSPGTTTNYLMSSTFSGLCVSGGHDSTNSGIIEYSVMIGAGDVGYSNLYGGIYNMGLWTIAMDKTLQAGNSPPYSFGYLDNRRKYRLFTTKTLTKNLGYIEDSGGDAGVLNYSDLLIKWRIHFT